MYVHMYIYWLGLQLEAETVEIEFCGLLCCGVLLSVVVNQVQCMENHQPRTPHSGLCSSGLCSGSIGTILSLCVCVL